MAYVCRAREAGGHIQPGGQGQLLLFSNSCPHLRRSLTTAVAIEPTIRQNSSAFVQKAI
jgi:hypothetical protein